jgi:hypothetical protein
MHVYVVGNRTFTYRLTILNEFDSFNTRQKGSLIRNFCTLVLF